MKKFLFSILLTIVFAIPFMTQAADYTMTPSYDVMHQVVDVGKSDVVAVNHESQSKNINLNMTSLNTPSEPHSLIVACDYESAENVNVFRVWGDSIGIGRPI